MKSSAKWVVTFAASVFMVLSLVPAGAFAEALDEVMVDETVAEPTSGDIAADESVEAPAEASVEETEALEEAGDSTTLNADEEIVSDAIEPQVEAADVDEASGEAPSGDRLMPRRGASAQETTSASTSIEQAQIEAISKQPYTGKAIKPSPKVTLGGRILQKGTDYTLSYANNTKAGTATLTVEGVGSYTGTKTATFQIVKPSVMYYSYRQGSGWEKKFSKKDGKQSGKAKRLEAVKIKLATGFPVSGGIQYKAYMQGSGWEKSFRKNGATSGKPGKLKRLEAIKVCLTGKMKKIYDVYYRVRVQKTGWMTWAKNGAPAGTQGFGYRVQALQITLVPKGGDAPSFALGGAKPPSFSTCRAPMSDSDVAYFDQYFEYYGNVFQSEFSAFCKHTAKKYPSLKRVGIDYGNRVNKKVDAAMKDMTTWLALHGYDYNSYKSAYKRMRCIMAYVGTHFTYQNDLDKQHVEALLDTGKGSCWALSELVYCMMRKSGYKKTWMCVPGRPIDHSGETRYYNTVYSTSNHKTVISYLGGKYYDLDGTLALSHSWGVGDQLFEKDGRCPEIISKSYARYLLGKSDSFTTFH